MGKLSFGKMLDCLYLPSGSCSCFCMNTLEDDELEKKPLITSEKIQLLRLKDVVSGNQTLAFQLKPKMVVLRVSMHCHGCARKVEKHICKLEGKQYIFLSLLIPPHFLLQKIHSSNSNKNLQYGSSELMNYSILLMQECVNSIFQLIIK
ncbi:uncharacterized protein LOC111299085 isoform X1 [Durio zibethinus]|uniref:Uncharacterized protein LOC111299085 isoform X1 n=1 Tax=Durio zibethinus TaxID=66656 RepID=A0A6P5ZBM0_DURZI|nr:uncharacterized protein LOC111299085 isoform X1 [Durio zibethinus]